MIPSTLLAVIVTSFVVVHLGRELEDDPVYRQRLEDGLVKPPRESAAFEAAPGAKASVGIFLAAIVTVMVYATLISDQIGLITDPSLPRNEAIMAIMLATGRSWPWPDPHRRSSRHAGVQSGMSDRLRHGRRYSARL